MSNQAMSRADELLKLKELLDQGILTQEEFDEQKKQILSSAQQPVQPTAPVQQAAPAPIIINNSASSSASASASAAAFSGKIRRKHNFLFDLFMIFITGGLWIIWMIFRPKYY